MNSRLEAISRNNKNHYMTMQSIKKQTMGLLPFDDYILEVYLQNARPWFENKMKIQSQG